MGCCNTCELWTSKIILIFFNVLFLALGIGILGTGLWFYLDPYILSYLNIADLGGDGELATNIMYAMMGIGSVMTLVSFCGLIGTCCGSSCMMITYCVLVTLVIIAQIALGILALANKDWVSQQLEDGMLAFVQQEYLGAEKNAISKQFDHTQIQMECCGATGREDYNESRWIKEVAETGWNWPKTCCVLNNEDPEDPDVKDPAGCMAGNETAMNTQGCYEPLRDWLQIWGAAISGSIIATALLQSGMICLACCYMSALKAASLDVYSA